MKPLTHASCFARVCCRSWTCEPHAPACEHVNPRLHQLAVDLARDRSMTIDQAIVALGRRRA